MFFSPLVEIPHSLLYSAINTPQPALITWYISEVSPLFTSIIPYCVVNSLSAQMMLQQLWPILWISLRISKFILDVLGVIGVTRLF